MIINSSNDDRKIKMINWYINKLQPRHRKSPLPAIDPNADRRVLRRELLRLEDGNFSFDLVSAKKTIDMQSKNSLWDLELRGEGRVFVGHWDDVTNQLADTLEFHPSSPPSWLSEVIL